MAQSGLIRPDDRIEASGTITLARDVKGLFASPSPPQTELSSSADDDYWLGVLSAAAALPPKVQQLAVPDAASQRAVFSNPLSLIAAFLGVLVIAFSLILFLLGESPYWVGGIAFIGLTVIAGSLAKDCLLIREAYREKLEEDRAWDASFGTPNTLPDEGDNGRLARIARMLRSRFVRAIVFALCCMLLIAGWAINPIVATVIFCGVCYFLLLLLYFGAVQLFEDNISVFVVLLVLAGVLGAPSFVGLFLASTVLTSLFVFIAHIFALGSAIKFCVNGKSPVFCSTYYLLLEVAICLIGVTIATAEISAGSIWRHWPQFAQQMNSNEQETWHHAQPRVKKVRLKVGIATITDDLSGTSHVCVECNNGLVIDADWRRNVANEFGYDIYEPSVNQDYNRLAVMTTARGVIAAYLRGEYD